MATRRQRENIMLHVLDSAGSEPLSRIDRKAIQKGRERRAATPSQAKNFISTMRGLFGWAVDADLVRTDPTQGISFKKSGKPKTAGFPVWTDDEIAIFEQRWPRGTRERVMFDVFLYTGLRRGDAAVVGKQHVRNGVITIDTEKTGMRVTIPILPELQATLDAGPTGDLAFIGNGTNGNPLTKESLGNLFAEACRAAGIRKSAHGLRKAAATNAANHGATVAELEAIFGWAGGQMAALYTRSANRRALASNAMSKLSRTETETSIPAPTNKVRAPERKT
ncbi:MAG: tyrosine-type recombinase/integrase [Beijerinckiaceae bacterium]|nr:tyrosine-type recombinase/integrase [Beijerinckiaceae bacterium]